MLQQLPSEKENTMRPQHGVLGHRGCCALFHVEDFSASGARGSLTGDSNVPTSM